MLGRKIFISAVGLFGLATVSGCDIDELKDALEEGVGTCLEPCAKVAECDNASPPAPALPGNFGEGVELPSNPVVDCAINCGNADTRVFNGYSDCQLDCVSEASCDNVNDCWDVRTSRYADYCIDDPPPPAVPEEDDSEFADAVDNPAVEEAVDSSGTPIYAGGDAPDMTGFWNPVSGAIDVSSNARPVDSPINTKLCFWDEDTADGMLNYCEVGVRNSDGSVMTSTAPISGDGADGWTTIIEFEYPEGSGDIVASIIFSGLRDGGTATEMSDVDALVTYYQGLDIWEHSFTDWTLEGASCDISTCDQ